MSKLRAPSVTKAIVSTLLEVKDDWVFHGKADKRQYEKASAHLTREYALATPQQRFAAGAYSLDDILGNLIHPYTTGDLDLLTAYEKFSVFKNPSLPIAVANFRLAVGRRRVTHLLTPEHLDLHDRIVRVFRDIISTGENQPRRVMDRKLEKLAAFVFVNMDHAEDILRTVEDRKLVNPKDITAILGNAVMPVLAEGVL